jgi:hypothetical protein
MHISIANADSRAVCTGIYLVLEGCKSLPSASELEQAVGITKQTRKHAICDATETCKSPPALLQSFGSLSFHLTGSSPRNLLSARNVGRMIVRSISRNTASLGTDLFRNKLRFVRST